MRRFMRLLITLTSVGVICAVWSGNALAAPSENPATAQVVSSTTNAAVVGARASASDIATSKVVVLADMRVKPSVRVQSPQCFWTKGGFWNSGTGLDGNPYSFWDSVPGKLCPSKKSKTGYVKVAGGTTGRNCGNVASAKRPPFKVVTGKVLMVRSFASVRVSLTAKAAVRVTAVCGWAEASASARTVVAVRLWVRSKGAVMNQLFASVSGEATAKASAQLECVTAPPPTPTPQPPTPQPPPPPQPPKPPEPPKPPVNRPPTVSIPGPQHVYEGGTVTYCVTASDPDGDSLTYSFTTNYGSVVGSGNCYTYQAPMAPMEGVTVTVTVNDGKGGIASATTTAFPVVKDDF